MVWTVKAIDRERLGGVLVLAEEVYGVFPKTLAWPSDVASLINVGRITDESLEILGVRMFLGTTNTSGNRTPKIIGRNSDGTTFYEMVSAAAALTANSYKIHEWADRGSSGAVGGESKQTELLMPPLFIVPGQSLVFGLDGTTSEVNTITANATPGTGTFTITVNGQTTAPINVATANVAGLLAAILALSNVAPGDVHISFTAGTNLGEASASAKIMWAAALGGQDVTITINTSGMTGNPVVLATTTAGVGGVIDAADTLLLYLRCRVKG